MTDSENYWKAVTNHLRKQGKFNDLTQEQAEKELATMGDSVLPEEEREDIIQRILAGGKRLPSRALTREKVKIDAPCPSSSVQTEFAHLNRNKGAGNSDTEALLKKLREEALSDDESGNSGTGLESNKATAKKSPN